VPNRRCWHLAAVYRNFGRDGSLDFVKKAAGLPDTLPGKSSLESVTGHAHPPAIPGKCVLNWVRDPKSDEVIEKRSMNVRESSHVWMAGAWMLAGMLLHHSVSAAVPGAASAGPGQPEGMQIPVPQAAGPAVGQSLFDRLFRGAEEHPDPYAVPYPFDRVVSRLEQALGRSINGDDNAVSSVLVPLGRCINRYAASPDFFSHPRIVVAAGSEHHGQEGTSLPFIKDRIFIGYQEMAEAMEVISYNEEAGRFEFQVVSNYAAGRKAKVEYVERAQCTGCHQNAGPIFSRPPWSETDNNPEIFRQLSEALSDASLEVPVFRGSEAAEVDSSTNRANLIPLFQEFWRGACESDLHSESVRCRAGLLETVLRYRLQERNRALPTSALVTEHLIPVLNRNIRDQWPNGISVQSSDVQDRNPVYAGVQAHLDSALELGLPRSLKIHWHPEDFFRGIEGLGYFIPLEDLRRLDRHLYQWAVRRNPARARYQGECRLKRSRSDPEFGEGYGQTGDISFNCALREGSLSSSYHLLGDLSIQDGRIKTQPFFNRLTLDSPFAIVGMVHRGGKIEPEGDRWLLRLRLFDSKHRFHARLPGGGIVEHIEIRWPRADGSGSLFGPGRQTVTGTAELRVLADTDVLDGVISRMIARADQGASDHFSSRVFRAEAIMDALLNELEGARPPQS